MNNLLDGTSDYELSVTEQISKILLKHDPMGTGSTSENEYDFEAQSIMHWMKYYPTKMDIYLLRDKIHEILEVSFDIDAEEDVDFELIAKDFADDKLVSTICREWL